MPLLIELLSVVPTDSTPIVEPLVQPGRFLGLIRPSSRTQIVVPEPQSHLPSRLPHLNDGVRHARYAQRNPHPRTAPFVSHFLTQLLIKLDRMVYGVRRTGYPHDQGGTRS